MSRKVYLTTALWAVSQISLAGVPEARALLSAGDYRRAFAEAAEPANQGDREAQFMLGEAYRLGRSVEPNVLIAEDWYTRASKQGHVGAAAELGLLYSARHAWTSALPWLAFAASNNEPRAMATLAALYYNGDGVPRDEAAAISLMTQAAAQGLPEARERLRLMGSPEPEVVATVQMMPPSPVVSAPAPIARAPVQTARAPVPAASAPVRVANVPAPVARAPVRVANVPAPVASAPVRVASPPAPVVSAPVRVASVLAPVASAPVQVASAPAPVAIAPVRVARAPAPVASAPVRVASAPAPVAIAPVRVASVPTPVAITPVRHANVQAPVVSAPVRVATAPAPVASAPVRIASAPMPIAGLFVRIASTSVQTASAPASNIAPRKILVPPAGKPARVAVRANGRFRVQVGAYRSYARAERAWTIVRHKVGTLMAAQHVIIRSGSLYRLQVVAFSAPAARALAATLNSARWPSFVHRTSLHTA